VWAKKITGATKREAMKMVDDSVQLQKPELEKKK